MAPIKRFGQAIWDGSLREGNGRIITESEVLKDTPYTFATRFEQKPGTNPEELIAAAHAACYSMALAGAMSEKGYEPTRVSTHALCTLESKDGGGFEITKMNLEVRCEVADADLDAETLRRIAHEADEGCPVSNLLREGLEIEINVIT